MAELPPEPKLSADGRFYWDGTRWLPMPASGTQPAPPPPPAPSRNVGCVTHSTCMTLVWLGAFFTVGLLLAGIIASTISAHH